MQGIMMTEESGQKCERPKRRCNCDQPVSQKTSSSNTIQEIPAFFSFIVGILNIYTSFLESELTR
jgi:hypothetical protein